MDSWLIEKSNREEKLKFCCLAERLKKNEFSREEPAEILLRRKVRSPEFVQDRSRTLACRVCHCVPDHWAAAQFSLAERLIKDASMIQDENMVNSSTTSPSKA
jgi:hypothetical protein